MLSVKMQLVLFSILAFIVIGSPSVYHLTDKFVGQKIGFPYVTPFGAPTPAGLLVHSLVFGLAVWLYLRTFRV